MKFVIDNYADYNSSQALYFQKHIDSSEEHQCIAINERSMSLFDFFDKTLPDCYISSANKFSRDALLYLTENKNIQLILSISNSNNSEVLELESILLESKVNCPFFITNATDDNIPFTKKIKIVRVMEGTDINLDNDLGIDYKIEKAVIVTTDSEKIRRYNSTFHVISSNTELSQVVDIVLPVHMMRASFTHYNEVIFQNFDKHIPQSFFESLAMGKKTYYDIHDKSKADKLDSIMDKIFGVGNSLNYSKPNKLEDFTEIQKKVLEKHTSKNRVKTLLSQIPKNDKTR